MDHSVPQSSPNLYGIDHFHTRVGRDGEMERRHTDCVEWLRVKLDLRGGGAGNEVIVLFLQFTTAKVERGLGRKRRRGGKKRETDSQSPLE